MAARSALQDGMQLKSTAQSALPARWEHFRRQRKPPAPTLVLRALVVMQEKVKLQVTSASASSALQARCPTKRLDISVKTVQQVLMQRTMHLTRALTVLEGSIQPQLRAHLVMFASLAALDDMGPLQELGR